MNSRTEKYLYPTPQQNFESLKDWLHEVRAAVPVTSKWDEEEFILWIKTLWFTCWQDVFSYLRRGNMHNKLFAWGIGKYWDEEGRCALAERTVNE